MKVGQDLFLYLFTTIPALIFSTEEKFKLNKPHSTKFNEPTDFRTLINIRIDLKDISDYLDLIKESEIVKSVESEKLIHELVLFINNYLFFQLKNLLEDTTYDTSNQFLDIVKTEKKIAKYKDEIANSKNISEQQKTSKQACIDNYLLGFYTDDKTVIELIRKDMVYMNSITNQKKRLLHIIESNIVFTENATSTQKNLLFLPLFMEVIAKLFFISVDSDDISIEEQKEKLRFFLKRVRK